MNTYMCIISTLILCVCVLSDAYIQTGLPKHQHITWLSQMSDHICQLPPGNLTPSQCLTTPQLVTAWAQNPYIPYKLHLTQFQVFPSHGKECAMRCELLLKRLVDEMRAGNPNAIANTEVYNALIDAWARSGEQGAAAERAEQILIAMQDAYEAGQKELQPNLTSFRHVLLAWNRAGIGSKEKDAAHRAQSILEWMLQLHEAGKNNLAFPNAECFDIVLHSWALSHHKIATKQTERLITLMDILYTGGNESVKPSRMSFNQLLTAYSKALPNNPSSAQKAEDLLNHMELLSMQDDYRDLKPNIVSYSTVVSAWSRNRQQDSAKRADMILKRLEDSRRLTDPDTIIFNQVIDAYAKSSSNKAHLKARSVLRRQIKLFESGVARCQPDVYSFTSVLSSCASLNGTRKERQHAFEIAETTYKEMIESGIEPNHVSYGTMLKSCARLLPDGKQRRRSTRYFFNRACETGYVGDMVLSRLREAATTEQYKALMRGEKKSGLPHYWTSNVPDKEKFRRRRKRKNLMP